ncbi:YbgF trimerization domain-containing protein [Rhizobium sp. BE258]|uniref:COG4223 family protein n=1 Tax=Rhizobium sp. BE258 TaxID=2817722 RepID=UPI00285FB36E|nr:YbgF trimerization domain-containing protein [Rhizobium sp. BE258]MDR7145691.1 hypothetical protein [Rhizobium sp. BE258]
MVSGNPPRHSKRTEQPVTIDLEAQEFAKQEDAAEMPAQAAESPDDQATSDLNASLQAAKEQASEDLNAKAEIPVTEEAAGVETRPDEAPYRAEERVFTAPPPQQRGGSTSGLIAAGIFGGLVALVGAGAIQYAGYLPGSAPQQAQSDQSAEFSAELDGLKQAIANLAAAPNPDDDALDKRIAALETAAKAPSQTVAGDPAAVEALNQKVADLTAQLEQLRSSITQTSEQQASSGADLTKRLDEAEKKLNEPRQDVAVAKAIAAAALKAAIDRGGPFTAELDTFAGVSPDDPATKDLRSFAQTGVPSRAELINQVSDVASAAVESANQPSPDQSWSDRLMNSAKSLVSVRPVGNIEGENVEAIAARMENKVRNGDLPGAANEWNDLPPAAKQASAAFKQSLEARIRVEDLVSGALSKAVSGTGKEG